MYVQTKLQFQAVLDQVFPEYRGIFGDLHSYVSLLTLQAFPTSEEILDTGEETIAKKIKELCKSRSQKWADSQADKLMAAAAQNPFQKNLYHSLILSLDMYINMLFLNTKSIYQA
jgi:transposase